MRTSRRLSILAGLAFLAAPAAWAQAPPRLAPPVFSAADADAVRAVIARYFAAFSIKDYATFRQVFTAPYVFGGRVPVIAATLDETATRYEAIRDPLDKADYSASKAVEIRIQPLRPDSVLAPLHWQRYRKDGSLLNEGSEAMLVNRIDGQWRIAGVLPGDLPQFKANR